MKIIGYTFDADCHCVSCAQKRANGKLNIGLGFRFAADSLNSPDNEAVDEHGISVHAIDNEDNPIHPLFSTDEFAGSQFCGDCHERIES